MSKLRMLAVVAGVVFGSGYSTNGARAAAKSVAAPGAEVVAVSADAGTNDGIDRPTPECLAKMLCELKEKVRWRTPAWTAEQCSEIAGAIIDGSVRYRVSPGMILGVILNESDLYEGAHREYMRDDKVYAADGGLGGLRCVFDMKKLYPTDGSKPKKVCTNMQVKGLEWKKVMEPVTNIELTAKQIGFWQDGGAKIPTTVFEGTGKRRRPKLAMVPCPHTDHLAIAHYNHGPRYIATGRARYYPHRVAVLHMAFAQALGLKIPDELKGPIVSKLKGEKERTADKPVGIRQRTLHAKVMSCSGACTAIAARDTGTAHVLASTVSKAAQGSRAR